MEPSGNYQGVLPGDSAVSSNDTGLRYHETHVNHSASDKASPDGSELKVGVNQLCSASQFTVDIQVGETL